MTARRSITKVGSRYAWGEPQSIKANSVTCLYFAADQPPLEEPILVLNGEGQGPINNLCVPSSVAPDCAPEGQHLVSVSVLTPSAREEEVEASVRRQAEAWFGPPVRDWRLLTTYDIKHALPDQLSGSDARPGRAVRRGPFVVCGDYLGNASIQSALESGRAAAAEIGLGS